MIRGRVNPAKAYLEIKAYCRYTMKRSGCESCIFYEEGCGFDNGVPFFWRDINGICKASRNADSPKNDFDGVDGKLTAYEG